MSVLAFAYLGITSQTICYSTVQGTKVSRATTFLTTKPFKANVDFTIGSRCSGVDLNRNYDVVGFGVGASSDPCDETYKGFTHFYFILQF